MPRCVRGALVIVAAFAACSTRYGLAGESGEPQKAVDELLAADRAFSAESAKADLVAGLSAMFADDVTMPTPAGKFAEGKASVVEALRANPENAGVRIEWKPVRGGVSADGQHGFTFGYMTWRKADGTAVPLKYLSYWVKGSNGWRVVAYKRGRAAGDVSAQPAMTPALPDRIVKASTDATVVAAHRKSLADAELAFSNEAQTIGIGPAFAKYGSADAVNMGGPNQAAFVVGADAISRQVGSGASTTSSELSWGPDKVIVASSGDLGVSIGMIRRNTPPADPKQPSAFPFFTVWRRANASAPWRYVAE